MKKEGRYSWTIKITIISFFLSTFISVITNLMLENVGLALAFLVLGVVVSIGIVFDIIGMSVTSTPEAPFHSMSTRGVKGSREAIVLIRNAEKVSNFCNDVIGDIVGIISGGLVTAIASIIVSMWQDVKMMIVNIILAGIVASVTIGGKALGKGVALNKGKDIIFFAGRMIYFFKNIFKTNKNKKSEKRKR